MKLLLASIAVLSFSSSAFASQGSIDTCIRAWGKSPFKEGKAPDRVMSTSVKVLGIGQADVVDSVKTAKPELVLVRPAVNVLGKSRMTLGNPNGWYCFDSNVSVLGKIEITADCNAHLASGKNGANVLGASDTQQGVTVLGSLRINRVGCSDKPAEKSKN